MTEEKTNVGLGDSDLGDAKHEVLSALREVAALSEDSGATSLAEKLRGDRIERLEEERFHLVVLGEFNHGKTTFVNAILGAPVLPMGVTPTTAVIHHIEHGEAAKATAVREEGSDITVEMEKLSDYVVDGEAARDETHHVELKYPAPLLEGGVVLVDTPGVNDLNLARAEITYGYIPKSDAILFLLDAGQILKESERTFVANRLIAGARDKVIFVVNKIDLLDDQERGEALAYASTNLAKVLPDPTVFAISAERALEGHDDSGVPELLAHLRKFLREERGRVLIENAAKEGLRVARIVRTGIEVKRAALAMEQGELERRLANLESELTGTAEAAAHRQQKIRESLAEVKALCRSDIEAFGRRFGSALPDEIDQSDAKDLRKYFASFVEDKFKQFSEQQAEVVSRRLERVAEEAIAFITEDARARGERLEELLGPAAPELDLTISTFAYDVGVFALGAFGLTIMALSNPLVGGAMTLAAPVLAWVFRGRADKQVKERAKEEAPQAVMEAAEKVADAFDAHIDEFGNKLIDFVSRANEDMTRSLTEVVRSVREARESGSEDVEEITEASGTALVKLADVQSRLEQSLKGLEPAEVSASDVALVSETEVSASEAEAPADEASPESDASDDDAPSDDGDDDGDDDSPSPSRETDPKLN